MALARTAGKDQGAWVTSSGPQLIRYPGAPRKLPGPPDHLAAFLDSVLTAPQIICAAWPDVRKQAQKPFPQRGSSLRGPSSPLQRAQSLQLARGLLLDGPSRLQLCSPSPPTEGGAATTLRRPRLHRRQGHSSRTELLSQGETRLLLVCLGREGIISQNDGVERKREPWAQQMLATTHPRLSVARTALPHRGRLLPPGVQVHPHDLDTPQPKCRRYARSLMLLLSHVCRRRAPEQSDG